MTLKAKAAWTLEYRAERAAFREIEDMEKNKLCQEFRGYGNLKLLKETISIKLYIG